MMPVYDNRNPIGTVIYAPIVYESNPGLTRRSKIIIIVIVSLVVGAGIFYGAWAKITGIYREPSAY
jgi:hypothetical protein